MAVPTAPRHRWPRAPRWLRRSGVFLVTALVLEYVVLPQITDARSALRTLSQVTPVFLGLGLALEMASLASYSALTRCLLPAVARPSFATVLRVDLSALGLSHIVPGGGATASALRYRLFTVAGVPGADVLSATAIEGTGMAAVLVMVFGAGLALALPSGHDDAYLLTAGAVAAVLVVAGAGAAALLIRREPQTVALVRACTDRLAAVVPQRRADAASRAIGSLAARLRSLTGDRRLMYETIRWASANWVFDAASLWIFLRAFGTTESVQGLLLGYGLAGVLALLPVTPGGLGLVEGALISVLVGFGTTHEHAVLGVITWRLAEFWMPIPLAALAYLSLRTGTLRTQHLPPRPLIPRAGPAEIAVGDERHR